MPTDAKLASLPADMVSRTWRRSRYNRLTLWLLSLVCLALLSWGAIFEVRTSYLQSLIFSRAARDMTFTVESGPSPQIRFPQYGPYDERVGYSEIPSFIDALTAHHFAIERQAKISPQLDRFVAGGGYEIYHEKARAGLNLLDSNGGILYSAGYPESIYSDFKSIPPLVVNTLLFIEEHHLLDADHKQRNPAIDWERFLVASAGQVGGWFDPQLRRGGGSTLATQIEKFRHSPGGATKGFADKLRQMTSASERAYLDGGDTTEARQRIVANYLNETPLSSRPNFGEVTGISDGLRAWYGTKFTEANRVLVNESTDHVSLARKAEIYKQVLSLLIAERRPSYYLAIDRGALSVLTDRYLRALVEAKIIDPQLGRIALDTHLRFSKEAPAPPSTSFVGRKAADAIRTRLLTLLHTTNFYNLDRLDLTAETTLEGSVQTRISDVLSRLGKPEQVKALGLVGKNMLGTEDPSKVAYSFVLYERGADRNWMRIHADSLDEPFDINSGAKLILGSTAKLRTLITYLDVVAALHDRFALVSPRDLMIAEAKANDPLTSWAIKYLADTSDRSLRPMLEAAMQRQYSSSPAEAFFTGGGMHVFHNFEKSEGHDVPTVEDAFERSINLVFVRLLRDISRYYIAQGDLDGTAVDSDGSESVRLTYLRRFADQEGRTYLNRFYDDYHGHTPDDRLALLSSRTRPSLRQLAVVFRSVRPAASATEFGQFIKMRLPKHVPDDAEIKKLYAMYAIDRFSLADRGYLAGIHPLELWLVDYLDTHPDATRATVLNASTNERQQVYGWLFKTHSSHKQDVRIRILQEEDAFGRILEDWRRQGYPFAQLVPSYATALGSSGDRPSALAHLMGIILNDGVELPSADIEHLRFASGTPYETDLALEPEAPKQVLRPEIAAILRPALMGVVGRGTGTRLRNVYLGANGSPLAVGGKTGTGDNRFDTFSSGQRLIDSRVVDRTATFVFFLGNRFFGTLTAYVPGSEAAHYHFTSALAVQLLAALAPELKPLISTSMRESAASDPIVVH